MPFSVWHITQFLITWQAVLSVILPSGQLSRKLCRSTSPALASVLVLGQMMASIWPLALAMAVCPYEIRFVATVLGMNLKTLFFLQTRCTKFTE